MPPKGSKKGAKRKSEGDRGADQPGGKAQKKDDDENAAEASHANGSPDALKTIKWLLSDKALAMITDDEVGTGDERSYRNPPGTLSPFEEVICAMLLAKPISHRLGLRSIKTVLNEPWSLTSPGKIIDAGIEKLYEALSDAKTQHKDKTADQLVKMAETLVDEYGESRDDGSLQKLREKAGKDAKKEREMLSSSIKGIGGMAIDLLYRRLQAQWSELYPFADDRTLSAVSAFDLPSGSARDLADTLDEHWDALGDSKSGTGDSARSATFALLLDRAIALELDKKGGRALNAVSEDS